MLAEWYVSNLVSSFTGLNWSYSSHVSGKTFFQLTEQLIDGTLPCYCFLFHMDRKAVW